MAFPGMTPPEYPVASAIDPLGLLLIWQNGGYYTINAGQAQLGAATVGIPIAITTPGGSVALGVDLDSYMLPRGFYITGASCGVRTPVSTAPLIVDINANGSSIFSGSTKLNIPVLQVWSGNGTAPTIGTTYATAGTKISFDVDQLGTSNGLKVWLMGYWATQ